MGRENSKASTKSGLLIASRPAHFEVKTLGQPIVISVCGDSAGGSRKKAIKNCVSCFMLYFFAGQLLSGFRLIK